MANQKQAQVVEELTRVKNVSERRAKLIYEQLEVQSIEELVESAKAGELQELSGIGAATESKILESARAILEEKTSQGSKAAGAALEDVAVAEERAQVAIEVVPDEPKVEEAQPSLEGDSPAETPTRAAKSEEELVARGDADAQERFYSALVCPNCGNTRFERADVLTCTACRREYTARSTVFDLAPPYKSPTGLAQRLLENGLYARLYDDLRPRMTGVVTERSLREEYALTAELLELREDVRLLDIACGTGSFTRYFANRLDALDAENAREYLLAAIDISWPMLEQMKDHLAQEGLLDQVFVLRGDAMRLPFKRNSFDRLHCAGALHLFDDVDEALRNFAFVLEPGGVFVGSTFLRGQGLRERLLKRAVQRVTKFKWFRPREVEQSLERAGFELIDHTIDGAAMTFKARKI